MSKRFFGFDCAYKTLAWSLVDIDIHIYSKMYIMGVELENIINKHRGVDKMDKLYLDDISSWLNIMSFFLEQFVKPIEWGVTDVLNGKKLNSVSEIERTSALSSFLKKNLTVEKIQASATSDNKKIVTIIEHQPPRLGTKENSKTNNKSTVVSHQLAFYYINLNPIFVDPKIKNNIAMARHLHYDDFLTRELPLHKNPKDARYTARKKHSTENFLYFVRVFKLEQLIDQIPNAVMDDLADSFLQILSFLVQNKKFT